MKSQKRGKNTLKAEIQNISKFGIWIFVNEKEYFLPYKEYPWFKDATVSQIHNVKLHLKKHLHWPDLDIDLELDALESPKKYPLIYKS